MISNVVHQYVTYPDKLHALDQHKANLVGLFVPTL